MWPTSRRRAALFDPVHARPCWSTCPSAKQALAHMVGALRPGGVLLGRGRRPRPPAPKAGPEETGPDQVLANRIRRGFRCLLAERGVDLGYGRSLPRRVRAAGLLDVAADAFFPVTDPACNRLETATINLIRHQLLDLGIATAAEIAEHLDTVAAGSLDLAQPPMISCWGRRPLAA